MNRKGFSLVEVMVVSALFTVICAAVYAVLLSGNKVWNFTEPRIMMQQEARNSLLRMSGDIRQANSVTTPEPGSTSSSCQITDSSGVSVTYSINADGELVRATGAGESILAHNISAVGFTREASNPAVIKIEVTAEITGKGSPLVLSTRVKVRNL